MPVKFEIDEYILVSGLQKEDRQKTIEAIHTILPYITDDDMMAALTANTLEKLEDLTDDEFKLMNFESYKNMEADE